MPSSITRCLLRQGFSQHPALYSWYLLSAIGACAPKLLFPLKAAPKPGCTSFRTDRFLQTNIPEGKGENQIYHLVSRDFSWD